MTDPDPEAGIASGASVHINGEAYPITDLDIEVEQTEANTRGAYVATQRDIEVTGTFWFSLDEDGLDGEHPLKRLLDGDDPE